jgi:hypothetical protein
VEGRDKGKRRDYTPPLIIALGVLREWCRIDVPCESCTASVAGQESNKEGFDSYGLNDLVECFRVGVVARDACAGQRVVPDRIPDKFQDCGLVPLHVVQVFQITDEGIGWGGVGDREKGEGGEGPAFLFD